MKKFTTVSLTVALLILAGTVVNAQRVAVTVAGTGSAAYTGDNGLGRSANITGLKDICIDALQNLYFVDQVNGRIRKLSSATGVVTTIAGGGASIADGIPAINASISPQYMCISPAGNLYLTTGNEIRKINLATGIITTVAGSAAFGFTGDGGPATAATFNSPLGICIDPAGNLYVADRSNNRVREINAATGIITTVAGSPASGYSGDGSLAIAAALYSPITLCLNAAGDLFISDQEPHYPDILDGARIRKVSAATSIITTIAGGVSPLGTSGVPLLSALLGTITGMCADASGNIFCNEMSCSCRELNMTTDTLDLIAGNFASEGYTDDTGCLSANMDFPMGICMDHAGNIYVADSANNRVRKLISVTHTPSFAFGPGQYMDPAPSTITPIDSLLWITDLDSAQTEAWTVVTAPAHGLLSGFPATASSNGTATTTKPSGLFYTAFSTYTNEDFFRVRVSDGTLSDTISVYVGSKSLPVPVISSSVNTPFTTASTNIFPNPASSVLNIQWTNMQPGNEKVVITDIAGREVYNTLLSGNNIATGTLQIDIAPMLAGIYFVKINGTEVRKFVKE